MHIHIHAVKDMHTHTFYGGQSFIVCYLIGDRSGKICRWHVHNANICNIPHVFIYQIKYNGIPE